MLYLLLTNEPSNHKEWAREERREGMKRGEERKRVREAEVTYNRWAQLSA